MQVILFAATAIPDNSRHFYETLLGLKFLNEQPHALVFDVEGVEFRIQKVEKVLPAPYTALGFRTGDIKSDISELKDKGITFEVYPFLEQDALGIWTTPDGARIAWCKDPDGNLVSLTQHP